VITSEARGDGRMLFFSWWDTTSCCSMPSRLPLPLRVRRYGVRSGWRARAQARHAQTWASQMRLCAMKRPHLPKTYVLRSALRFLPYG